MKSNQRLFCHSYQEYSPLRGSISIIYQMNTPGLSFIQKNSVNIKHRLLRYVMSSRSEKRSDIRKETIKVKNNAAKGYTTSLEKTHIVGQSTGSSKLCQHHMFLYSRERLNFQLSGRKLAGKQSESLRPVQTKKFK